MANTTTRGHVASEALSPLIPVADLSLENRRPAKKQQAYEIANDPIEIITPQNRREKRKQKRQRESSPPIAAQSTQNGSEPKRKPPNNPPKKKLDPVVDRIPASMPPAKEAAQAAYPLLVCSIGNQGGYRNTLHSAGHYLTDYITERKGYKPFTKGLSGLVSRPDNSTMSFSMISGFRRQEEAPAGQYDWTFWQSTEPMNLSGRGVKAAYNEWLKEIRAASGSQQTRGRLVVIHDELESDLGIVKTKASWLSAQGHNGLKSCQERLQGVKWWRVGVGIGRPDTRRRLEVSQYVLSKVTNHQRDAFDKSAIHVFAALEKIASGETK